MATPKSRRLLKRLVSAWAAVCSVYFMWEALGYRGFFARLAEWQIGKFGAYAPLLTYLVLVAIAVVPALMILWFVTRTAKNEAEADDPIHSRIEQAKRIRAVLMTVGCSVLAVAIGFCVYAVWFLPAQAGQLRTIAVNDVGSIEIVEGPARFVGGELGTIIYFGQDWYLGEQRAAFAPYRPSSISDGATRVFVELDARDPERLRATGQRLSWSGIVVKGGLPGTARALFSSVGISVADPYYTLYRTEYDLKARYWLQAIQWTLLAAFIGFLALLQSRRIKRLKSHQPHSPN